MSTVLPTIVTDIENIPEQYVTIVSACPFGVENEYKPGLTSNLSIPSCKDWRNDISVSYIKTGHTIRYLGDYKSVMLPVPPQEIALSLIRDWADSQIGFIPGFAEPAVFILNGRIEKENVKKMFTKEIDSARSKQLVWFSELMKMADDLWAKTHQHRSITGHHRLACTELGLEREWNIDPTKIDEQRKQNKPCPACFTENNIKAALCKNCRCILDPEKLKSLKFAGE